MTLSFSNAAQSGVKFDKFRAHIRRITPHVLTIIKRGKSGWNLGRSVTLDLPYSLGRISVGKLAQQANGSAEFQVGGTRVLATVVSDFSSSNSGFLPLTVEYRQKASATGKIPSNFLRRDLAMSNNEILISRKIDRSFRPMFPDNFLCDTHISCSLYSYDRESHPDVVAINAASAALAMSSVPMKYPVGAVKVGWLGKNPLLHPTKEQMADSELDLVIVANEHNDIVMLEGSASQLSSKHLIHAIHCGANQAAIIARKVKKLQDQVIPVKIGLASRTENLELTGWIQTNYADYITSVLSYIYHDKFSRDNALQAITSNAVTEAAKAYPEIPSSEVREELSRFTKTVLRDRILRDGVRPDGRGLNRVRDITCAVDIDSPLHGSSLFQRGQTQVMATVTLDSLESMAKTDPVTELLVGRPEKNFMLHYEFPQFATGELPKGGGVNRRELGHGALAEKGLRPVIPADFPFTIRVSTEVLESNGSSSMASVCAGSLALLDAGVPIKTPAAGVAMGLITRYKGDKIVDYAILHDIMGMEDYAGDLDFKIAGTEHGITAIQADMKIPGISARMMGDILKESEASLKIILSRMNKCISEPRSDRKETMPASEAIEVPLQQRARVIGVGGTNLKHIQSTTGVTISTNEDLTFQIFAPNKSSLERAKAIFTELLEQKAPVQLEFGDVYQGKVLELQKSGVSVQIHPQMMPVFIRNSQLDMRLVHHSEATGLQVGDTIHIKYFGSDPVSGEERWSRRAILSAGGFSKNLLPREEVTESSFYRTAQQLLQPDHVSPTNTYNSHDISDKTDDANTESSYTHTKSSDTNTWNSDTNTQNGDTNIDANAANKYSNGINS